MYLADLQSNVMANMCHVFFLGEEAHECTRFARTLGKLCSAANTTIEDRPPFRFLPSRPTSLNKVAGASSNKLSDEHDNLDFTRGFPTNARGAALRNGSTKEGRDKHERASSWAQRGAIPLLGCGQPRLRRAQ